MGRFWNHQTELTTFTMIVSLNQTWVHLPNCNKAHLLTAGCGEGKGNVYCRCQEESRQLALKRPELSHSFQGQIIKGRVRGVSCEVCDQLMDNLLTGWWWGIREPTPSIFWFPLVWGLHAVGNIQSTSSTWWGFQYLQTAQRTWLRIWSAALEEKLKVLHFV